MRQRLRFNVEWARRVLLRRKRKSGDYRVNGTAPLFSSHPNTQRGFHEVEAPPCSKSDLTGSPPQGCGGEAPKDGFTASAASHSLSEAAPCIALEVGLVSATRPFHSPSLERHTKRRSHQLDW